MEDENVSVTIAFGKHQTKAKGAVSEISRLMELGPKMSAEQVKELLTATRTVMDYAEVLRAMGEGVLSAQQKP